MLFLLGKNKSSRVDWSTWNKHVELVLGSTAFPQGKFSKAEWDKLGFPYAAGTMPCPMGSPMGNRP